MVTFTFLVPVETPSASNLREHWASRSKRSAGQRLATRAKCPMWTSGPLLVVTLTRVSPRTLDDDNLRGALKAVRDAVASWLRVDDASPLVRWEYKQEVGKEPAVRVEGNIVHAGAPDITSTLDGMLAAAHGEWTDADRAELLPPPRKGVSDRRGRGGA